MPKPKKSEPEKSQRAAQVEQKPDLRNATGTESERLRLHFLQQVAGSLWFPKDISEDDRMERVMSALAIMEGIKPEDHLEGALAVQMVATHHAAIECLRRAMLPEQTFEGRDQNLKHAAKLMGVFSRQFEGLDKHRGKGQQKVTVEHVNVQAGGQAIVGNIETGGTPVMPPGNRRALAALAHSPSVPFEIGKSAEEALQPARVRRKS
jgi:hypothetical protein